MDLAKVKAQIADLDGQIAELHHRQDMRNRRTVNRGSPMTQEAAYRRYTRDVEELSEQRKTLAAQLPEEEEW